MADKLETPPEIPTQEINATQRYIVCFEGNVEFWPQSQSEDWKTMAKMYDPLTIGRDPIYENDPEGREPRDASVEMIFVTEELLTQESLQAKLRSLEITEFFSELWDVREVPD